jgi:NTE family protein
MGVDVVIVVNVGTDLLARDELRTFVNVLDQMQLLLGRAEVTRQLKSLGPRDVLITPDLEGLSVTTFDRAALGIARGRAARAAHVRRWRDRAGAGTLSHPRAAVLRHDAVVAGRKPVD